MKFVRLALGLLALAGAFVVFRQFVVADRLAEVRVEPTVIEIGAALVIVCGGLAVGQLRPRLSTGPLLTFAGFALLLSAMAGIESAPLDVVGSLAWACFPLVLGHVLLSHPDGLKGRRRMVAVTVCWLVPLSLGLGQLATSDSWRSARLVPYVRHPSEAGDLAFADRPDLARALAVVQSSWVAVVGASIAIIVMMRARNSGIALRPSLMPIAWAGIAWATGLLVGVSFSFRTSDDLSSQRAYEMMVVLAVVVPAVTASVVGGAIVWTELLRPRLDPARDGRIVLTGEALPVADVLRQRLARALGDPSLRLAIQGADGEWLTPDGKRVELRDDEVRATTTLTRDGQVIAALEHDHALRLTPDVVVVATTMAGLAIDNVRLTALDAAQAEEMRSSGELLLAAADRARRQLTSTIARGPAARLDDLSHRAEIGLADIDHVEFGRALRDIASEVRAISHGLFPPELEHGGLAAALDHADEVPSRRYPQVVELTAYLVAAGRTGARLHDRGGMLVIELVGLVSDDAAARVAALDGSIVIEGDVTTVCIPVPE